MVKSKVSNIVYPEKKYIEMKDDMKVSKIYTVPVKFLDETIEIFICFGNIIKTRNKFYKYMPIYIVKENKVTQRIGSYEFHVNNEQLLFDSNKNIVFEHLSKGEYLLFKHTLNSNVLKDHTMKENNENENESNDYIDTPSVTPTKTDVLFDDNIVFSFFIRSANAKPGKGINEKIPTKYEKDYKDLESIPNWRHILSNFYVKPIVENTIVPLFIADNKQWASVEHYFQAQKFLNHKDYFDMFTLESGTDISKSVKLAKEVGEKGKLYNKVYIPKNIKKDELYLNRSMDEQIIERAQRYKYEQDKLSRKVLQLTNRAKLQHIVASKIKQDPIIFYDTMKIRNEIFTSNIII